jgi:tetratricopeptide (TPR) repeat protein
MRKNSHLFIKIISLIIIILSPVISLADADRIFKENNEAVIVVLTYDRKGKLIGQGSGFVVRQDGAIVTNYHVISNAANIKVRVGEKILEVEGLLHIDKKNDIVILKAKGKNLKTVKTGDIEKLAVGEKVYVISSPQGLENTISDGILSGIREIEPERKILQITAPISKGSSGGAVFNKNGEVVGIATFLIEEAQNINFAMPVNLIKDKISVRKVIALKDAEIKDYKETAEYWVTLGLAYYDLGMHREAIDSFKQAIWIEPDLAKAHYYLGAAYSKSGMDKEAIESSKQAIRIKPDVAEAHYGLGMAYFWSGRLHDAIEAFKQAIRIKPDFAMAYYLLGLTYLLLNDRGSALEEYKILKELNHELANKLFNLIYE